MVLESLVTICFLAPIGALTTYLTNRVLTRFRKKDAYNRLVHDPLVYVGKRMLRIKGPGDVPVVDALCVITLLAMGRMEVLVIDPNSDENGCVYSFTGMEFERLVPVFLPNE